MKKILTSKTEKGFPGASNSKESACNAGDLGSILGLVRSPGEENGYPLQYSCLENSMNKGAWQATVHGVTKSQTWLSDFHFQHYVAFIFKPGDKLLTWIIFRCLQQWRAWLCHTTDCYWVFIYLSLLLEYHNNYVLSSKSHP